MSVRLHYWQLAALILTACALSAGGFYWHKTRRARQPSDLVVYLPTANASVAYIDVDAMRRSGILGIVAGSKTMEEPDYQQFVSATKFDYRQDLDAVAAAIKDGNVYFALRGRFHWKNLRDYAVRQGGWCHNDFCVATGSQPNRRISFYALKSDVMAMAVSPDDFGAYQVSGQSAPLALAPPKDPVWAMIPAVAQQRMESLPEAAKVYVPALQGADQILFSVASDRDQKLQFGVQVTCKDPAAASTLLTQLESTTKTLRGLLTRQRSQSNAADVGAVLVAGTFRRDARQVYGTWPLPKAFVDAITGGGY